MLFEQRYPLLSTPSTRMDNKFPTLASNFVRKFLLVTFVGVAFMCPKTHAGWPEYCQALIQRFASIPSNTTCFVLRAQLKQAASNAVTKAAALVSSLNAQLNDNAENLVQIKKLQDSIVQASHNTGQWKLLLDTARNSIKGDQLSLSSWKDAIDTLIAGLKQSHRPIATEP